MTDRRVRPPPSTHSARGVGGAGAASSGALSRTELERVVWEREMRRLRVGSRVLVVVLVALIARGIVSGVNPVLAFTAAVIVGLLIACLRLAHQGRELEPSACAERRPLSGGPGARPARR